MIQWSLSKSELPQAHILSPINIQFAKTFNSKKSYLIQEIIKLFFINCMVAALLLWIFALLVTKIGKYSSYSKINHSCCDTAV